MIIRLKKNNYSARGFSLLELILAVAIFSLSSFATATLLIDSNTSTRFSSERIIALSYAKEGIEAVRSIRNTSWDGLATGTHSLSISGDGQWSFSDTPDVLDDKYTRVVSVADTEPFSTSTKNVYVSVSWSLTPVRPAVVTLKTALTNWSISSAVVPVEEI